MKNNGVKTDITKEKIFGLLLNMDERMTNLNEQVVEIRETMTTMATKNDLENMGEDLLKEIRPLHKAIDKDARTIILHGKRIAVLERRAGVAAR